MRPMGGLNLGRVRSELFRGILVGACRRVGGWLLGFAVSPLVRVKSCTVLRLGGCHAITFVTLCRGRLEVEVFLLINVALLVLVVGSGGRRCVGVERVLFYVLGKL